MASKANDNHITEQHQYTHQKETQIANNFLNFQNINLHNNIFQR